MQESQQQHEINDESLSYVLSVVRAQVEAGVAILIHVCHLIIAEGHHSVHGDALQHAEMAVEHMKELARILESSVSVLANVALENCGSTPSTSTSSTSLSARVNNKRLRVRSIPDSAIMPRVSAFAKLGNSRRKSLRRRSDHRKSDVGAAAAAAAAAVATNRTREDPAASSSSSSSPEVSYEALFEKRLTDFAEFQRKVLMASLAEIRKRAPLDTTRLVTEEQGQSVSATEWKDRIQGMEAEQEAYLSCFFASVGTVTFPKLSAVRRDTVYPASARLSQSSISSSQMSSRPSKPDAVGLQGILLDTLVKVVKRERPHVELISHSFMQLMMRNQHYFLEDVVKRVSAGKNPEDTKVLRHLEKLQKIKLDTDYLTRAYTEAMRNYSRKLGFITSCHFNFITECRAKPELSTRISTRLPEVFSAALADLEKLLAALRSAPPSKLHVVQMAASRDSSHRQQRRLNSMGV
ncbi:unnamed protein product [Notodromas monacha]|uniref:Uncharacterized protein n=1 Tax=Notodromas monacha TaxID=399045 RepID=A0A7R9GHW2_9CRUS|nr:unnamed protein product [Notodromas monacha]CAG0921765.1 unnamed protein product [Notodromas monacha]